jgi:hypothetical protein
LREAVFAPSREQVRELFFGTWAKYRAGRALEAMEALALEVILQHPEYHALLDDPERYREREYFPEMGETNPFLHMSLHIALEEQLSIDQPRDVVQCFNALTAKHGARHAALHDALECLAEMVWRSQREGTPPDAQAYLECLGKRGGRA